MYIRLLLIMLLGTLLAGCMQLTPEYMRASEYQKAAMLYENGLLLEARSKAERIKSTDADFPAARKLLEDIYFVSVQVAKRHQELGEDYERAGIFTKAVYEYNIALQFNPTNIFLRNRVDIINMALKAGVKPEPTVQDDTDEAKKLAEHAAKEDRAAKEALKEKEEKARKEREARVRKEEDPEALAAVHYNRGKAYLDAKSYAKAIGELRAVLKLLPDYLDTESLLAWAKIERDKLVDYHLKKGIEHFQKEEMGLAIKEWDIVTELDPSNKTAIDYRYRAEVIMERLKKIQERNANRQPL